MRFGDVAVIDFLSYKNMNVLGRCWLDLFI